MSDVQGMTHGLVMWLAQQAMQYGSIRVRLRGGFGGLARALPGECSGDDVRTAVRMLREICVTRGWGDDCEYHGSALSYWLQAGETEDDDTLEITPHGIRHLLNAGLTTTEIADALSAPNLVTSLGGWDLERRPSIDVTLTQAQLCDMADALFGGEASSDSTG